MPEKKVLRAEVQVLSGRHAGVTERLPPGMYLIGNSFDADIVLTDDDVAPRHFRLGVGTATLRIEAVEAPVEIDGRVLAPGEAHTGRYPGDLAVGPVKIACGRISAGFLPGVRAGNLRSYAAPAGVTAAACAVVLATLAANSGRHETRPVARAGFQPAAENLAQAADEKRRIAERTAKAAAAFGDRLIEANLRTVSVSEEFGLVMARGSLDPGAAAAWREAQLWFDKAFGPDVMLVSEVSITPRKKDAPPLSIQSVWAGESPYVMDARGEKYFEGSLLGDGWIVERIEADKVTLRRASEILTLRL